MATNRDPDDIEALLAEVEGTLGGRAPAPRGREAGASASLRQPVQRVQPVRSRVARSVPPALAAAALVAVLFVLLPLLGAVSGALGAFLGALLAGLWARWRG